MAKRLVLVAALIATMMACKGTKKTQHEEQGQISSGTEVTAPTAVGRDAVERALLNLGIEGSVLRIDLNEAREGADIRIAKTHLTRSLVLLETNDPKPRVFALTREGLQPRWVSDLMEPTAFPIGANPDVVVFVSRHYAHALETFTGRSAFQFTSGGLQGVRQPPRELPFTPTGGAAVGNDTFYIPSLGSPRNNKTIESFSLMTGSLGWGRRTSAEIMTTPRVGGPSADPKLYLVTRTGHVECMDATNYGFAPDGLRWEQLLEAGVDYDLFVTPDTAAEPGSVFLADREGVVYCLNRITGKRRWIHATGQTPRGGPKVFGPICVVPMQDGLCAFDAVNVMYGLTIEGGPEDGSLKWVRAGAPVVIEGVTFKIEGEVLTASGKQFRVNRNAPVQRSPLYNGSEVMIGNTVVRVADRGTAPLWSGKDYDEIVGRLGDMLVARKGTSLTVLNAWTGELAGNVSNIPGARLVPVNTTSANLFVIAGNATIYAFFPR